MTEFKTFTAIVLSNEPIILHTDSLKIKIFGKDYVKYSENDYYDSFFHIDIKKGFVLRNKKDPDYREPIIKSMIADSI